MSRMNDMIYNVDLVLISIGKGINANIDDIIWSLDEALRAAQDYRKILIDTEDK